jgi:hypothetical protein
MTRMVTGQSKVHQMPPSPSLLTSLALNLSGPQGGPHKFFQGLPSYSFECDLENPFRTDTRNCLVLPAQNSRVTSSLENKQNNEF